MTYFLRTTQVLRAVICHLWPMLWPWSVSYIRSALLGFIVKVFKYSQRSSKRSINSTKSQLARLFSASEPPTCECNILNISLMGTVFENNSSTISDTKAKSCLWTIKTNYQNGEVSNHLNFSRIQNPPESVSHRHSSCEFPVITKIWIRFT